MKEVVEEVVIPEQRVKRTKYVASDGQRFDDAKACLLYEDKLEVENNPVFKSRIADMETVGGIPMTLFYVESADDIKWLQKHECITNGHLTVNDFSEHGAGWYMFYKYYNADRDLTLSYFRNFNAYMRDIEKAYKDWGDKVVMAIYKKESGTE